MSSERTITNVRKRLQPQTPDSLRISVGMIAFNEEEYIEYSIRSIYEFVHEIIIIEGAVQNMDHATPDGHSTDRTLSIVRNMGDPDKKIRIIHSPDRFWKDKAAMRNAYIRLVTGNFLMTVDADEVYRRKDIQQFITGILENPRKICFPIPFLHFWKDFWHTTIGSVWNDLMPRHYRLRGGEHYRSHAVLSDAKGTLMNGMDRNGGYDMQSITIQGVSIFHYGYVKKQKNVTNKLQFYHRRGQAVMDTFSAWKPGQHTQPTNRGQTRVIPFIDELPEVMTRHPYYNVHAIEDE